MDTKVIGSESTTVISSALAAHKSKAEVSLAEQLDDIRLQFISVYLSTGNVAKAYELTYAEKNAALKAGQFTAHTMFRLGSEVLASAEIQDFLLTRRDIARTLAIATLPDVVFRLKEMVTDPKMNPKAIIAAARLLSDMAGLTKSEDTKLQLLIQNIASLHPAA